MNEREQIVWVVDQLTEAAKILEHLPPAMLTLPGRLERKDEDENAKIQGAIRSLIATMTVSAEHRVAASPADIAAMIHYLADAMDNVENWPNLPK